MNKVKYGLSNVYYSKITYGADNTPSYAVPVPIKGAVNLDLSVSGSSSTFYADNIEYFTSQANSGYEGDLEIALIPDSFRTDILGDTADSADVYSEYSGTPTVEFALLFQFEGDAKKTRHCFYRCTCSKPNVAGATVEDTVEPQTETLNLTAMPRLSDHLVKSRCDEDSSAYATWFSAVYTA